MFRLKILAVPFIFYLLFFISSANAESIPAKLDSLILQGKEHFYRFNISKAQQTFDIAIQEYPNYPHGYFYQAYLTLIIFSQDMMNDSLAKVLDEQINISVDKANEYKKDVSQESDDLARQVDAEFHLGVSYGLKAINAVVDRNYFGGYWSGRKAKNHLENVVELAPDYNDAYLGLGIFHYYVDLLPGILKFFAGILGFDGDKARGRNEVLLTSQNGHYFKVEAKLTHTIIRYFLEGEKRQSLQEFLELYKQYPSNAALSLILGYHYRRFGHMKQSINYCESVPDSFVTILPQIVDIKYYNLAVARYDLNMFGEADSLFSELIQLPTKKSLYYQSAIKYYKGILKALSFDRDAEVYYLGNIFKNNKTKYWYYKAQMPLKYPMDSLMYKQIYAQNLLYSRHYQKSMEKAQELKNLLDEGMQSKNPDMPFLIVDLLAENHYYQNDYREAKRLWDTIAAELDEIEDEFERSWIHIHYARCLIKTGNYKYAEKMLDEAKDIDEDFTRLIIEREKFVLTQAKQRYENTKG